MRTLKCRRASGAGDRRRHPIHLTLAMWALACIAAGLASAAEIELGPAPFREEVLDTATWIVHAPKAARTRAGVVALYQSAYLPGNNVALTWTGSIASCDPGKTNLDHQQAVMGW